MLKQAGRTILQQALFADSNSDKLMPQVLGSLSNYALGCYELLDSSVKATPVASADLCKKLCLSSSSQV
jgi:hypothetical protein